MYMLCHNIFLELNYIYSYTYLGMLITKLNYSRLDKVEFIHHIIINIDILYSSEFTYAMF